MKKAFCEPGNIDFCPPISVAEAFNFSLGGFLTVMRSPDNGGDRVYTSRSELEAEFQDGSLHPGDLKAATTALMVSILDQVAGGIKADKDAQNASKILKQLQKKLTKTKK